MKKILIFLIVLFSYGLKASGPTCPSYGIPDPTYFNLNSAGSHPDYTLKLYFNVVTRDDGSDGYDHARIPNLIATIDGAFNPHGIYFEYVCDTRPVKNTSLDLINTGASTDPSNFCNYTSLDPSIFHTDGIDIFLDFDNGGSGNGNYNGAGIVNDIPGYFAVITNQGSGGMDALESTTIIHELGHLFGLHHMFRGSFQNESNFPTDYCSDLNSGNPCGDNFTCPGVPTFYDCNTGTSVSDLNACAENSTNGAIAGDLIPDTPPSFHLAEKIVPTCQLDPSQVLWSFALNGSGPLESIDVYDPDGNPYAPDVTNFMSVVAQKECRDHFTPNQVTVMKNHIANHPTLIPFHSTKGQLTCDCNYDKIIYLRENENWLSVINEYNLDPNSIDDFEIVVESTLTLDVDYSFKGINFTMGPDSEIDITNNANISIQKDNNDVRSVLMACDSRWRGIRVENGSSLSFTDSDIYETIRAIDAEDGSSMVIDNIVCIDAAINAIRIDGDVPMVYNKVKVRDSGTAVLIRDSPFYYNLTNSEVSDSDVAIFLINSSGEISDLITGDILIPIILDESHQSMILNNQLKYDFIGMHIGNTTGCTIEGNSIGSIFQYGLEGIRIRNSNNFHIHNNPKIIAEQFGIRGMQLFQVDIYNNPDISVSGIQSVLSGGVFLTTATECDITDNYISGANVIFGVESNNGINNSIRNNDISINVNLNFPNFRSAAIRSVGSIGEEVIENETYSSDNANGILAQNTAFGHYECNYIYDTHDALCIEHNSDFHKLVTNHKIDAQNFDFVTRSRLGDQINHGNEYEKGSVRGFWNPATFDADLANSRFLVDENVLFHMPSDPIPDNGQWYRHNGNNDDFCSGTPSPGSNVFFSIEQKLCDYWDDIKALKNIDPELFVVKVTHLIRYFDAHPLLAIPDCIALDPVFINVCGLHEIMDGVDRLSQNGAIHPSRSSLQVQISDMLALHQEYINSSDPALKANKFSEIATAYTQTKPALDAETQADEAELQIIKNDITSVSCSDLIIQMMRDVWKAYITELGVDSYDNNPRIDASLVGISQQCSDKYGDAIHLARSIVSMQGSNTYYDTYDGCNDVGYSSPRNTVSNELEMMISPNPTSGNISIEFTQATSGRIEIYSMDGTIEKTLSIDKSNNVLLEIEKSGVHIIRYIQNNGIVISKKVISIK